MSLLTYLGIGFLAYRIGLEQGKRETGRGALTLDGILNDMAEHGELAPGVHPQAIRSALMGAVESLMRDHLLARTSKFPASYNDADIRLVFERLLNSCLAATTVEAGAA